MICLHWHIWLWTKLLGGMSLLLYAASSVMGLDENAWKRACAQHDKCAVQQTMSTAVQVIQVIGRTA